MKKYFLFFIFFQVSLHVSGQADIWEAVITDGFSSSKNYNIVGFAEFKDTLYATCGRKLPGVAEMWRSADGLNWEEVIYDKFTSTTKGIASINATLLGGGYMWIGTGDLTYGTQIYRTQNGTDWIPISKKGFGDSDAASPTPNMVLFKGSNDTIEYLYAASNSHGGPVKSKIWRTPYTNTDSLKWDLLIDFNNKDTGVTQITYFYIWNNKLYFGGNGDSLLYESGDGINFTANKGVASDFLSSDLLIACLIDFNGFLYAGTNNQTAYGGQLYRTKNGTGWDNITALLPDHGKVDTEIHAIDTSNGYLWIAPYTDTLLSASGMPVWRSTDNTVSAFVQSNIDGFGSMDIDGENPGLFGFKGWEYFGGPDYVNGAQIWRTQILSAIRETDVNNNSFHVHVKDKIIKVTYESKDKDDVAILIYNASGQLMAKKSYIVHEGVNTIEVNCTAFSNGIYFMKLVNSKQSTSSKVGL